MATGLTSGNRILRVLSDDALQELAGETRRYEPHHTLFTADETPEYVFFPHHGAVVSIVRSTAEGGTVEAGICANEGMTSVQLLIAEPAPTHSEPMVQLAGDVTRIPTAAARATFERHATFRHAVLEYASHFMNELTQNAVCNRLHSIEQRLAKWLLVVRDRTDADDIRLTHDFLSHMLGVHRPGVSIAVSALELDGLIGHTRNVITIQDRDGLVARSCECYSVVHAGFVKLRAALDRLRP